MCPLKDEMKAEAQRLGFSLCGITTPDPPDHIRQYRQWIQSGYHAAMSYLAREDSIEKRAKPKLILPEVKSVVVLGACYPFNYPDIPTSNSLIGQISSYAWSADYHTVLKDNVQKLVDWFKDFTHQPIRAKICIDSAPVLERSLAWRAGLGWIGKNGSLIHPQWGSFFFLSEIFLDVEISPDEPQVKDFCGNCHHCMDACPTHCILPDRTIDASQCISYLTIEKRGDIPRDLRSALGNRVFGCDICQQVCPWNQKANRDRAPDFSPFHSQPIKISLTSAIDMTEEEFNNSYQYSPILRTRYEGFLRNIVVALGNSKDASVIPALQKLLNHSNPIFRLHAAWALGQFDSIDSRLSLENAQKIEIHPDVRAEIQAALSK
jgi:epoxyqueuosine reductase